MSLIKTTQWGEFEIELHEAKIKTNDKNKIFNVKLVKDDKEVMFQMAQWVLNHEPEIFKQQLLKAKKNWEFIYAKPNDNNNLH